MSATGLIIASLRHHWRMHLAVGCGVAAAVAVLTGALIVGDSMRWSLRLLAVGGLGRVDYVLATDHFFREELADELAADRQFQNRFAAAVPAIVLEASAESSSSQARAHGVNLYGCDARFWSLGQGGPAVLPRSGQVALNEPLAKRLQARVGDRVLLRLPSETMVPAESLLGRKEQTVRGYPLEVASVIAAQGLGRFRLRPDQREPLNAYVPLSFQSRLRQSGKVNAILVAGRSNDVVPPPQTDAILAKALRPTLADYGVRVERYQSLKLDSITTDRMLFTPAAEEAILAQLGPQVQPALVYVANTIARGQRAIPYSTVAAVDFALQPPLGPMVDRRGSPVAALRAGEIALNEWAADDLEASIGDTIRLSYFEPESAHAAPQEKQADFRLAAIVKLEGVAADRSWTPEVPGVTDQKSINDWDPPFPFDRERVRSPGPDEEYWDRYGPTPKAYISLPEGRRLWASRFGQTTSLRLPSQQNGSAEKLAQSLVLEPAAMGFTFQPVKRLALGASTGTTSFGELFLAFSFFIIAAAVMLVALLYRLGVERRAEEIGVLLAIGIQPRQLVRWLTIEGALGACVAAVAGAALGVGYAALMLWALRTWWVAAVATSQLALALSPGSLLIGLAGGLAVALIAIGWTVRRIGHLPPRRLLAGATDSDGIDLSAHSAAPARSRWGAWALTVGAVGLGLFAMRLDEQARAGAFFAAGFMVLTAALWRVRDRLRRGAVRAAISPAARWANIGRLAVRNAARNPGRSTLSIGLVASTSFLIAAISAFRVDPSQGEPNRASGNGGFAFVAESDQPVYGDLASEEGQARLGIAPDQQPAMAEARIYSLRVRPGDDASCLNLYQPREPRILGVPPAMVERGGFAWAAAGALPSGILNPWKLLELPLPAGSEVGAAARPAVPVVLDKNTAAYSLHLGMGDRLTISDGHGKPLDLVVVGLLATSILQGDVLMSEANLVRHFPAVQGYRFFLVETSPSAARAVSNTLEKNLGDYGMDVETTGDRLAAFLAVQNTYLSTFQSLGGLGLLLGTLGLAAVEVRSVVERRKELALLRALGLNHLHIAGVVMIENAFLLLAGLACGLVAALVAVLPHIGLGGASVPWAGLTGMLAIVLVTGVVASLAAVRAALLAPITTTLRGQ